MKRSGLMMFTLLVSTVLIFPLTTLAQEDGEDMQTFVSQDELMTFSYPTEWYVDEVLDLGFPAYVVANSEEVLAVAMDTTDDDEQPAESGQIAVQIVLFPMDIFAFSEIELTDEMADEEIATVFINTLLGSDEESGMAIGEPELMNVDDELVFVTFTVLDEIEAYEGIAVVYEVTEGILLLGIGSTYVGEFDEALSDMFVDIFASIEYTGTAEDLMLALMSDGIE